MKPKHKTAPDATFPRITPIRKNFHLKDESKRDKTISYSKKVDKW